LANLIGPLIGASVEKKKGNSPVKGAILGSLIQSASRTAVSLVVTAAAGYVLKKIFDKTTGDPAPAPAGISGVKGGKAAE
jgi:hypothetical protein